MVSFYRNQCKAQFISPASVLPILWGHSLRKHPFLLALRCWGHFAQRNICESVTVEKFHTDDVKSVQNLVRSADWSTEQLHCCSYCLQMTDKRQTATKVKCKREESLTKQSIFVEYSLLQKKHMGFGGASWQNDEHNTFPKSTTRHVKLDKFTFGTP